VVRGQWSPSRHLVFGFDYHYFTVGEAIKKLGGENVRSVELRLSSAF